MSAVKVQMKVLTYGKYEERAWLEVSVDGKYVGGGGFGGEPEDNSRGRDYCWVEPLVASLVRALGAEVECVEMKGNDE